MKSLMLMSLFLVSTAFAGGGSQEQWNCTAKINDHLGAFIAIVGRPFFLGINTGVYVYPDPNPNPSKEILYYIKNRISEGGETKLTLVNEKEMPLGHQIKLIFNETIAADKLVVNIDGTGEKVVAMACSVFN